MRRFHLVLVLGLAGGLAAHFAWYGAHRPCTANDLDCQLQWMQQDLHLTDGQLERIREIHRHSSPQLLALSAEVARLRDEYAAFDRERLTAGYIDFLEFARFVEQRRAVDRRCLASTERLLTATAEVMNPEQRDRYFGLFVPFLRTSLTTRP